jgi:hypothetical protein
MIDTAVLVDFSDIPVQLYVEADSDEDAGQDWYEPFSSVCITVYYCWQIVVF